MEDLYNHNIIVEYINNNINDDETDEGNSEKQEIYQKMFLKCLYLEEYNDTEVMGRIDSLYNRVKSNDTIKKCCEKIQQNVPMLSLVPDIENKAPNSFMFLFAYDYFEYFHLCLVDLIKAGDITQENEKNIMKKTDSLCRK